MALTTKFIFRGVVLENAYVRVNRIFGGKTEGWGSVVGVYASKDAAASERPIDEFNHSAKYEGEKNPLTLVYQSLKAEIYPDATDC